MYRKAILKNGLRVVTHDMPAMESFTIGIWLACGGRYEDKEMAGISHYIEHLLFKGTKTRSALKIKEEIEGLGGSLNGFTSEEFTCYLAKVMGKYAANALNVLSDMVLHPRLSGPDVEKERTVILEEIKMYHDMPSHHIHDLLNEVLWPDQPLGMPLAGYKETIEPMSQRTIRDYKERLYIPANIVIAACGRLDHAQLLKNIEKIFANVPAGNSASFSKAVSSQDRPRFNIFFKETQQIHLSLGLHGIHRAHPDRYALALLHIILGANMSSRLFQEIREKRGLVYEIGSYVKRYHDTGALVVDAGTDKGKLVATIKLILRELARMKRSYVKRAELRRAKDFFMGQFVLALEDTSDHMLWLGENLIASDKVYAKEEIAKGIERVDEDDIKRLAGAIIKDEKHNLALIGPLSDKEKKEVERLFL